jgi:PAS domain S-box-containing protein
MAEVPAPSASFKSLDIILSSIGDGVIAADTESHVTYLNRVAEQLTGWSLAEAQGKPLESIFRIVNEETHATVENPALRALREGVIFGLANHTLLITRDGKEIPIDDSGAPIKDESGALVGAVLVFRAIAERRKAERAQGVLAAIVESAEDAIVSKNIDGIIESWNIGAERLFGYSADEAIGKSIRIIIPPDLQSEEDLILQKVKRGERVDHFETVRMTKSGRPVEIDLSVSPVRNKRSEVIGASKIARDIRARKQREREHAELLAREHEARELAEAATIAKDEFIAQLSHELRTPLTSILGWTKILRTVDYERSHTIRAVDTIDRNAKVQLRLIEDLIDLSRIVQGKMQIQMLPLQITEVISQALETVAPAAEAKSITIQKQIQTKEGLIHGDADRLLQVLWNLLSNAVKFTPKGGQIALSVKRLDHHLELSVKDSGVGIDPAFIPFVFDRFAQAGKEGNKHPGLGLGLAIVRYFVELHGGTITAESAGYGKGATFTIMLPSNGPGA